MLIISKNVKLTDREINVLKENRLLVYDVDTTHGADDAGICIERLMNSTNKN